MLLATKGLWPVIGALALGAGSLAACTPSIGDSCQLSTDCASDGTRICDTSEPGGYCTVINCTGNNLGASCPDNAVCILFNANIPGCPFSARRPASTGVSQCRNTCGTNSDCRGGYICGAPNGPPWSAEILDPNQTVKVCLPALDFVDGGVQTEGGYGYTGPADAVPPVCQAAVQAFDSGFPPLDAGIDGAADAAAKDAGRSKDAAADSARDGKAVSVDSGHSDTGTKPDTGTPDAGAKPDAGGKPDAAPDAHPG
jgi:hypothetical protein